MKKLSKLLLRVLTPMAHRYLKSYGLLQTSEVFNRSALVWEPGNEHVLVLAPHMDDEVIGCGGTLAKHVSRGATVTVAYLTDGRKGGVPEAGSSIAATRKRESQRALAALGIQRSICFDAEDGRLASSPLVKDQLKALLLEQHFDLIYLPFFLEEHPDHRAVSQVLLDATAGTKLNPQCFGYEIWTPLFPNCLVNIDDTVQLKREALSHYRSQLERADFFHTHFGLNAFRSVALKDGTARFAEAFCAMSLDSYRSTFAMYLKRGSEPAAFANADRAAAIELQQM